MLTTPMRRRLLIAAAALFAGALLLVLTVPFWLGAAVRTLGPRWGVTIGKYERLGYGRFAANDIVFTRENVRVTATRLEGDTPLLWLWRKNQAGEATVGKWAVEVTPRTTPAPPTTPAKPRGWVPIRTTLRRVADALGRWLPRTRFDAGAVKWQAGGLTVASATWEARTLTAQQFALSYVDLPMDATVGFPADADEIRISVKAPEQAAGATLTDRAGKIAGDVTWWDQRTALTAQFGPQGWLPTEASVLAEAWALPAARLRLGGLYSVVRGGARIEWSERAFRADITAAGEPLADKKAPPLEATLRGHGDMRSFTVEAFKASLPGVVADLSAPFTIERSGALRESAARFAVQLDLAQQPWFEAGGRATAEASLASAGGGAAPRVEFRVSARDLTAERVEVAELDATGRFEWPRVEITAATLVGRSGERLRASGGWNFQTKEILPATVEGDLRRATIARWLPAQPQFDAITLKAQASGPLASVKHAGTAQAAGVAFSAVKPLAVEAAWSGTGAALEDISGTVTAASTRLAFTGALDSEALRLSRLELAQGDATRLQLTQPAIVRWRPTLQVENVRLAGPAGGIDADLTWGATGRLTLAARKFSSTWLADIIELPGPEWELDAMAISGEWDRGPMTFTATAGATIALDPTRRAILSLSTQGNQDGVVLKALRAAEGANDIVNISGIIPLVLTPGGPGWGRLEPKGALTLDADTAPNASFWRELTALTGVELVEPSAAAHVRGTWEQPTGDVQLRATRVAVDPARFQRALPTIEGLDLALTGDRGGVRLERLGVKVEGQEISARGRLPVEDAAWAKLFKEPLALLRREAELRVDMPDVDLAAFARFIPSYLAPKGRLTLGVSYNNGAFDGGVKLSGAATRPLGPLGVVQDIEADIGLSGRTVSLRSVKARSGGEEVQLTGRVELPETPAVAPGAPPPPFEPRFDLALKGENLPFVRRTGLLVRGDLDLKLTTPERGEPRLSGLVRLRDSLFLQDIRGLLPGGPHSTARRPPYFSVDTPPLHAWRLDIRVEGDQFMRLRTTVFNGVATARFHLGGTLGEPVAIGEATISDGRVNLPFASFEVQEGRVSLTRENIYEPQLWLTGVTRRYGYDIRMELSGAATAPLLSFTSSPPLEHGQVLLMVMAGEAPKDEVTYSTTERAARLGAFLGQSLISSLGRPDEAERFSLSTGEKVSRQGRETYLMEYRLSDRWSITGEKDEFDEYNAGVKWRVYTKHGKETSEENADAASDDDK